ncbi:MAG: hypothetical protein HN509_01615 [Halobacteriovoraceae bacterium]|jgi:hypothetical protein|nr:hypothetical protein [Halobacteriovoraceae bacterium]MBT5095786.1 hypothetical protein [Halobacteriovoraceae bacterium]
MRGIKLIILLGLLLNGVTNAATVYPGVFNDTFEVVGTTKEFSIRDIKIKNAVYERTYSDGFCYEHEDRDRLLKGGDQKWLRRYPCAVLNEKKMKVAQVKIRYYKEMLVREYRGRDRDVEYEYMAFVPHTIKANINLEKLDNEALTMLIKRRRFFPGKKKYRKLANKLLKLELKDGPKGKTLSLIFR